MLRGLMSQQGFNFIMALKAPRSMISLGGRTRRCLLASFLRSPNPSVSPIPWFQRFEKVLLSPYRELQYGGPFRYS